MNKKIILIIVIIILIAVGAVLFFLLKPKGYKSYFNEEFDNCMELNQQKYYQAMARKTRDATYCDKLPAEGKTKCLAGLKKDVSVCDEYPEEQQAGCKAEILQNPELCELFDYWCLAYASGDEKYCQQLEDEASTKECLEYVRNDAEVFISPQAEQTCKDSAYVNAAIQTQDVYMCNKIIDPAVKQSCLDVF